jgi:uncharacterized protein GlcG (DUF336 family)
MKLERLLCGILFLGLVSCGGGGGGGSSSTSISSSTTSFTGGCSAVSFSQQSLSAAEVDQVIAQAVSVASTLGQSATVAVVDRVGNVLGVFQMSGGDYNVTITSNKGVSGGLESVSLDSKFAAISKAITGAYLSSSGNAFSTRTAGFIIQDHYIPQVSNSSAGPLYGVQFSQLGCGDLVQKGTSTTLGPRRSPLGLAADPGGFPLYKNGMVVGGIGVVIRSNPTYTLDLNPTDIDYDLKEIIAQSATSGFTPQTCIRANQITANGVTLRYSDSDDNLKTPSLTTLVSATASYGSTFGALASVTNYYVAGTAPVAGTAYGNAASGFAADSTNFSGQSGYVMVTAASANRYPPTASSSLSAAEVTTLLQNGLTVANATRAQIRKPLDSAAQVTISVVDQAGVILGIARTTDAPMFGTDVSLQKARTASFFSFLSTRTNNARGNLSALNLLGDYISSSTDSRHADVFFPSLGNTSFNSNIAFSARAIGSIHRPYFPDGIEAKSRGPLSKAVSSWSPFNIGLQLDLVQSKIVAALSSSTLTSCTASSVGIDNGIQVFPGGVPIYKSGVLVGGIGVSGDGVDQDDMISFLAVSRTSSSFSAITNAVSSIRSSTLTASDGNSLRYVQCPQAPFLNSTENAVCE